MYKVSFMFTLQNVQFQKISISPRRDWNFLCMVVGEGSSVRPNNVKKWMKLNWNFQKAGGSLKILSVREVWIFSGTIQFFNLFSE